MGAHGGFFGSQRARAARVSVTVYAEATLASLLLFATLTATLSPTVAAASFAATATTIACALLGTWAGRRARARLLTASLLLSLLSFEVVAGLFAAQFGALSGIGLGVLIASWSAAEWLAPRRPKLVALGVLAQTLVFLAVVKAATPSSSLAAPAIVFIVTGMIVLTAEASSLGRRDSEDRSIWRKLESAHRELERHRSELASTKDGLHQEAEQQLTELLAHAKTSEQLDRLLAERVAGRSRALVREVDRRPAQRSDALTEGIAIGPARILGRITPGPYQRCYLGADISESRRRFLVNMIHSADAHARVGELNAALDRLMVAHPSVARVATVVAWGAEELAVVSEQVPGRMLIHAIARPDLSWGDALVLGHGLADALALAHGRGCLHLGLDPYRIVMGRRGSGLAIYGLGLIQAWHTAGGLPDEAEQLLATPAYRAPESAPSSASDVYSLGVIIFELISKLHPFVAQVNDDGSNAANVLRRLEPRLDQEICQMVQAMLSRAPQSRPAMSVVAGVLSKAIVPLGSDLRSLGERLSGSQAAVGRKHPASQRGGA